MFVCLVSSAADVPVSPVSESQNRLLSSEQQANNIGDHLSNNTLQSGGLTIHRRLTLIQSHPMMLYLHLLFGSTDESETIKISMESES